MLCATFAAAVERRKKGCSCEQIIPQRAAVEDGSKINGSGICTESARKREKEREQTISQSSERAPNSIMMMVAVLVCDAHDDDDENDGDDGKDDFHILMVTSRMHSVSWQKGFRVEILPVWFDGTGNGMKEWYIFQPAEEGRTSNGKSSAALRCTGVLLLF